MAVGEGFLTIEKNDTVKPVNAIPTEASTQAPTGSDSKVLLPEELLGLCSYVKARYDESRTARHPDEIRWLRSYNMYRMEWGSVEKLRESEKSRASINITKLKTLTGYGSLQDVLFSAKQFPITVDASPKPEGVSEVVHLDVTGGALAPEPAPPAIGYAGDGKELPPGATEYDMVKLGGAYKNYEGKIPLANGPGKAGEPEIYPARKAAKEMEKKIIDQLLENRAAREVRKSCFEMAMLGTGGLKGPLTYEKTLHKWEGKEYAPQKKKAPKIEQVSIWDLYPDPFAKEIEEAEYMVQRHRMTKEQVRKLKFMPKFNRDALIAVLSKNPQYTPEWWEQELKGKGTTANTFDNRYEVLEFWGILDYDMLRQWGHDLGLKDDDERRLDSVHVNVWICGSEVLRCIINPFTPNRIPYYLVPYERDPYRMFGVGIPERMYDAQMIMIGHLRMAIDNLNLSGNVILEVDEQNLIAGQSYGLEAGKIFYRATGAPGQAINSIQVPNVSNQHLQMFDKARMIADEETGIPSVMHGQTGVSGTGRTSSGLSMIMNQAGLSTKNVVKNLDDFLLKPLGEALFAWNMQFASEECPEIVGDLEIKPNATTYMMMKEVRSQRLGNFLSLAVNPMLAPFVKLNNLLTEYAISQDLNPAEIINDLEDAKLFAEILKGLQANAQAPTGVGTPSGQEDPNAPGGGDGSGGAAAGTNPADQLGMGNGNIGPATPSPPGTEEFSGSPQ